MDAKIEKLKNAKIKLKITVTPKEMVKYFNNAYEKIAPTIKLDGFRPGKAPRQLTEETIGITRLLSEALDQAVQESYFKALSENMITPVNQPNIVINKYPKYGENEETIASDFEFEAEVEILPEVVLGDYSKLKIDAGKKEEVKKDDVEKILAHLQKQRSNFEEIDRPATKGDLAEISFEGSLKNVRIDAMCSKNHPVVLGESSLIPGFEDEIIGMKKGEEKTFKIKFPKDYHSKEYAGKEAEFKVSVNELKKVILPEINDEFAAGFGQKDVAELKKSVEKNLEKELEEKYEHELEAKAIEKVLPLLKVEVPASLVEREIDRMIHDFTHQLEHQGLNFEAYLSSIKKTNEEMRKDMGVQAEKNVKVGLLLGKIIQEQKMDHNAEDSGRKAIKYLVDSLTK